MPDRSDTKSQICPSTIFDLIERFDLHRETYQRETYNETQVRREFIDPFFKELGWDMDNKQGHAEAYKDVIHEDAIKVGGSTKAPDYCFRIGGAPTGLPRKNLGEVHQSNVKLPVETI